MRETLSILTSLSEPSGLMLVGLALIIAALGLRKVIAAVAGTPGLEAPPKHNSAAD